MTVGRSEGGVGSGLLRVGVCWHPLNHQLRPLSFRRSPTAGFAEDGSTPPALALDSTDVIGVVLDDCLRHNAVVALNRALHPTSIPAAQAIATQPSRVIDGNWTCARQ